MERASHTGILAAMLVAVLTAAGAAAQPPTPPSAAAAPRDPRIGQITRGLERAGVRVYRVDALATKQGATAAWLAETEAPYTRPSFARTEQQAALIWAVMAQVLAQESPQTLLLGVQVWTRYGIVYAVPLFAWTQLMEVARTPHAEADRRRANETFRRHVRFGIFDLHRRQYVDAKDFVNKNFEGG